MNKPPRPSKGSLHLNAKGLWTAIVEMPAKEGKRQRRAIRSTDRAVAEAALERLRHEADTARGVAHGEQATTFEYWAGEWQRSISGPRLRPKTSEAYDVLLRHHILPVIGAMPVADIRQRHVREVMTRMRDNGKAASTIRQAHRVVSLALKEAMRDDIVARNVAELVDPPILPVPNLVVITPEQASRVIRMALDDGDPLASLWAAAFYTGARQGELLGLELNRVSDFLDLSWQLQRIIWQHGCGGECDWKRGSDCPQRTISVAAHVPVRRLSGGLCLIPPKSKAGTRVVPLVEPLAGVLRAHIDETKDDPNPWGLVWHHPNGSALDASYVMKRWKRALTRAGVPNARFHDARHTAVDLLYAAGVPEADIGLIVGHSTAAMSRAYRSRPRVEYLREAMASMSSRLDLFDAAGESPQGVRSSPDGAMTLPRPDHQRMAVVTPISTRSNRPR